ncbi:MAG: efflux RND transporter periplasmic adaptor subunit [Phycisphaerales bacterium]
MRMHTCWVVRSVAAIALIAWTALAIGCWGGDDATTSKAGGDEPAPLPTNRIAIPDAVRSNLGISFMGVERRQVEQTLRVPGRFEYLPTARREYHTVVAGRIELLVEQFDTVEEGDTLYRIDSPTWREMQQQLAAAQASIHILETRLRTFDPLMKAHEEHEASLRESAAVWAVRVKQLESLAVAGGGRGSEIADARATFTSTQVELAGVREESAQLDAAQAESEAELLAARARLHFLIDAAASITGIKRALLAAQNDAQPTSSAGWSAIDMIDVRAAAPGRVELIEVTNGAWADVHTIVLTIVRPDQLRFHASGLQSDLGALRDGLAARIVPPVPTMSGRGIRLDDSMTGTLSLGLNADSSDRTVDLYVQPDSLSTWARPGVAAQLEIVTDSSEGAQLAIPLAAVQRDGLMPVIFRRAPDNPNEAIRIEADLGLDDGRWVVVKSGLRADDEVVLDGAFQLMLATSGTMQKGGHFHADGTFHEDH